MSTADRPRSRLGRLVDVVELGALAAVVVAAVMLFTNSPGEPASAGPVGPSDGATLFASNCAVCHSADGSGGVGPRIGGGRVVEIYPDAADQILVVTNGRGGMPAFGTRLSTDEIAEVVRFTRTELGM